VTCRTGNSTFFKQLIKTLTIFSRVDIICRSAENIDAEICEVAGQHAGANAVTGDFSLMASGFKVENGKVAYPVDQIIIAGNFNKMLLDIEKVGNDTFFDLPLGSVFASPSLYIPKGIKVSGE